MEFLDFVKRITPNVTVVRGEFDNVNLPISGSNGSLENDIPLNAIIRLGEFKIGCCSGYSVVPKNDPLSLLTLARQLDVDIMLWGGTHNVEAYTLENKFFVNPGSCTGAFNTDWPTNSNAFPQSLEDKKTKESRMESENAGGDEVNEKKSNSIAGGTSKILREEDVEIPESEIDGASAPSFCLLDIQGPVCTLYIYIYIDGDVKVDKIVYEKELISA